MCNSLEGLFPSVAAEFDVDKNGFAASEVIAQSSKTVWWRKAVCGSWEASVQDRTNEFYRTIFR